MCERGGAAGAVPGALAISRDGNLGLRGGILLDLVYVRQPAEYVSAFSRSMLKLGRENRHPFFFSVFFFFFFIVFFFFLLYFLLCLYIFFFFLLFLFF